MIHIRQLDHIVLRVRDLQPMLRFYTDVLGCKLERSREDLGLYHLRAGASLIDLVTLGGPLGRAGGAAPGPEGHNVDHFCLQVDAFEPGELAAWLRSRGVTPGESGSRFGAQGEGPSLYLRDPEGNGIELKGPPAIR
jgi:glyoxylase I family protein